MSGECDECGECPFECLCQENEDIYIGFNIRHAIQLLIEASHVESELEDDVEALKAAIYFIDCQIKEKVATINSLTVLGPPCQHSTARCIL